MTRSVQTLLWVDGTPDATRALVEPVAAELGLSLRVCTPPELPSLMRTTAADIVAIELDGDAEGRLELLRQTSLRVPQATLLAVVPHLDVATVRAALAHGASDAIALPLGRDDLARALLRATQAGPRVPAATAHGDIIVVYGVRGGLGATTLAVNLAGRLCAAGEVALVDLDLQRGDASVFLDLSPTQSMAQIAAATDDLDAVFVRSTLTRHASGLMVLAAPPAIEDADAVGHAHVAAVLRILRAQCRYVVVDTPRTIGAPVAAAFEGAERILVVTDLSVPGVRAAHRTVELLERLDVPGGRIALVVTNAVPGAVELADAVRVIGREPIAVVPRDVATAQRAANGGAMLDGKRSPLSTAIAGIVDRLTGATAEPHGGLLRRFFAREAH